MPIKRRALLILTMLFTPSAAYAQVFDLGPSSPSLFDTVVDIPPGVAMTSAGDSTQINLALGGTLLDEFDANAGSEINISGGTVGPHPTRLNVNSGSEVNISGGRITNLVANSGSVVNFFWGGDSNSIFTANASSVFNFFGDFNFRALFVEADSQLNFYGLAFSLNDVPMDGLEPGVPFEITDRGNVTLNRLLSNGEQFAFGLGRVDSAATITATLVPEQSTMMLALLGAFLASAKVQRCSRPTSC